jgi:hypothetical protein
LRWLAGLNKVQHNTVFFCPEEHRLTRKFRTVVADNRCQSPTQIGSVNYQLLR